MSVTTDRKPVKAEWASSKIQSEVLKSVAAIYAALDVILAKDADIAAEAAKAVLINKLYYAEIPIDTPKDLGKAVAEYSANVFGVKVSIVETGTKYTLVFNGGALVNKLVSSQGLSQDASERLIKAYKNGLADLGANHGFVTEVSSTQPDFIVSFSK